MNSKFPKILRRGAGVLLLLLCNGLVHASIVDDIAEAPIFLRPTQSPSVMLTLSNDHQLYFEAYKEYADLNEDGKADGGYLHEVDYYGYFDSYKCYAYNTEENRYQPIGLTDDKYCDSVSDGDWSGNFLNWVSMSRMDVVRKILYGGYRSTDEADLTVLERVYIPTDVHAWVRYYNGDDLDKLTPFENPSTVTGTSSTAIVVSNGSKTFSTSGLSGDTQLQVGDQLVIDALTGGSPNGNRLWAHVTNKSSSGITVDVRRHEGSGTHNSWRITNRSRAGISICNVTRVGSGLSEDVSSPPLLRIASGDYSLWKANERWQCHWHEERNNTASGVPGSNGNTVGITGLYANNDNPVREDVRLGGRDFVVRVEACRPDLVGTENCKDYPEGSPKPVGLLQEYGDEGAINFGLMTGSYLRNKSGGVLRKNIGSFNDEVNVNTDGTFQDLSDKDSIVNTINLFRLVSYNHGNGNYNDCPAQSGFDDGDCKNWGNPQAEMHLEAVRYFAKLEPTAAFDIGSGTDGIDGLRVAEWNNPIGDDLWCSQCSIVNFNASVTSYDMDQLGSASDLPGSPDLAALTNAIGVAEGIQGKDWFVGNVGDTTNDLCTPKEITSLAAVEGLCPDAPSLDGGFLMAGLAHYAHTTDLRPDLPGMQTVKTYSIALEPALPRIDIPKPGESESAVTLLPACQNTRASDRGSCAIIDFKIIDQDIDAGTGSFLVQWEAHEQGGDFDSDMNGIISYTITDTELAVTTRVFSLSAGMIAGFGYVLSGTETDGYHAHSGVNGYTFNDPSGGLACTSCQANNAATTRTYTLSADEAAEQLQLPGYYAAKWGGFDKAFDAPTVTEAWDTTGNGLPDNYYFAINPIQLAEDLSAVFAAVLKANESSTAIATNSTRLDTETTIFQAMFDSGDWYGDITAYKYATFEDADDYEWRASERLEKQVTDPGEVQRTIVTFYDNAGIAVSNAGLLDTPMYSALNHNVNGDEDSLFSARVAWLRGEDNLDAGLRSRTIDGELQLLGDIVNSDPQYVGKPNYGNSLLPGAEGSRYKTFRSDSAYKSRSDMIYVAANDGMLHGFDAVDGTEYVAYIPSELLLPESDSVPFAPINRLMMQNYTHRYFVDGTATIRDAYINSEWKTVLVGTMGAGGRTVFALDVTDPKEFGPNKVLWEFQHEELGYGVTNPTITRLATGEWAAVFGNGYGGSSNTSQLFVVNLATGLPIKRIDTGVGGLSAPNGMAPPYVTDWSNGDRIAALAYAGDLLGNLWRFDLTSNDIEAWTMNKIFTTQDLADEVQPITAPVIAAPHPDEAGTLVLSFGTGSYFRNSDAASVQVQSLYGIFDRGGAIVENNQLIEQEIIYQSSLVLDSVTYESVRATTAYSKDDSPYDFFAQIDGWKMDLQFGSVSGERVVSRPSMAPGRSAVRFTTLMPDVQSCGSGRYGYLMELDLVSGSRPTDPVFDLDLDGVFNTEVDTVLVTVEVDGIETTMQIPISGVGGATQGEELRTVQDEEGVETVVQLIPDDNTPTAPTPNLLGNATATGRQSWEQLR